MAIGTQAGLLVVTALLTPVSTAVSDPQNWCQVGQMVMIPDGREGPVTSVDGSICRVLAYGEKYVGLWPHDQIEPVGPPPELRRYHQGF
jgi:hypothetical protein